MISTPVLTSLIAHKTFSVASVNTHQDASERLSHPWTLSSIFSLEEILYLLIVIAILHEVPELSDFIYMNHTHTVEFLKSTDALA
jgi:hypothetical protein